MAMGRAEKALSQSGQSASAAAHTEAMAALSEGDLERALQILMDVFGKELYRFCLMMLGSQEEAEDVLQTCFLRAYRDLENFRGDAAIRTWLYSIARHRCLDHVRAKKRRERRIEVREELPEAQDPRQDSEERSRTRETARFLWLCLEKLKESSRSAVLLRHYHGFRYPEMAEISGEREPALRMRVTRALPVLRQCLEEHGVEAA